MNTLLHFLLLLYQSYRGLRNVSFGSHILGLMKSAYHGWLSMMTSSGSPLFSLASGPPNFKPTTGYMYPSLVTSDVDDQPHLFGVQILLLVTPA